MADNGHLDELVGLQSDPVAKRLLGDFAELIRDPTINAADCPARLRRVMDELFREASSAPDKPDSP